MRANQSAKGDLERRSHVFCSLNELEGKKWSALNTNERFSLITFQVSLSGLHHFVFHLERRLTHKKGLFGFQVKIQNAPKLHCVTFRVVQCLSSNCLTLSETGRCSA